MKESGKRKNKGPNFNVYVGTTFRHEIFCEIEALAASHKFGQCPGGSRTLSTGPGGLPSRWQTQ